MIQNIHFFARDHHDDPSSIPYDRVILFDEAQRAWNQAKNFKKFKRDLSEPEMVISIMERSDWGVLVALVGSGQEINDGEAGLAEWGRTLDPQDTARKKEWQIFASPVALGGGPTVAGTRLFDSREAAGQVHQDAGLHLNVSIRSLRAEHFAAWVDAVLSGDAIAAQDRIKKFLLNYPVVLTRDLLAAKQFLRANARGSERAGLVGSSGAGRLRADGLEPSSSFHADYSWPDWFLSPTTDLRSSSHFEVFATEFEMQGLELDWIGLCWGGDFAWSPANHCWQSRTLSLSRSQWNLIRNEDKKTFRRNAYRVLLTRARKGLVLYVPPGILTDPTRQPAELDETANFLLACGVAPLHSSTT